MLPNTKAKATKAAVLEYIHIHKTGALLQAGVTLGAILGGAKPKDLKNIREYGFAAGVAFQITDDMVNPDGVEYDISDTAYKGWKKNTRKLLGGVGVDLNHNFPVFWGTPQNGLADIASDEYKGTAPFSEPETTALRNFITQSPNIRLAISYHTYGEQIFYPWFASASPVPNEQDATTLKLLASKAAALTGYAAMQGGAAAPNTGDFSDWLISTRRILPLEIVLSPNSKMPLKDAIAGFYPGSQMIDMIPPVDFQLSYTTI